ncbi:MAG TPA: ABC transporter permease subunit [Thermodesulfobacteriota bacterium]|nr:ABC transporter permease subunit [Thermodesulfobacteriota bacterium]
MSTDAISQKVPAGTAAVATKIRKAQEDPPIVRWGLTFVTLAVIGILVIIPVVNVFTVALGHGVGVYLDNLFANKDTFHAIKLTLTVVPIAVGANLVFGISAAWAIARFSFPGRALLTALIELPFAVSPVVAGLSFVLIFGLQGYFGPFLREDGYSAMPYLLSGVGALVSGLVYFLLLPGNPAARKGVWKYPWAAIAFAVITFAALFFLQQHFGIWPRNQSLKIIFALPGLVLATAFVTFPFIARELIPTMEAVGSDEELAAVTLGASGWQMFRHVTVPNIKWGLAYGIILCNARAMGEFGAVYVVSGHIAGKTDTMPLRIEKLFQEFNLEGSYAVASVLTLLAILTLIIKTRLERKVPASAALPGPMKPENE